MASGLGALQHIQRQLSFFGTPVGPPASRRCTTGPFLRQIQPLVHQRPSPAPTWATWVGIFPNGSMPGHSHRLHSLQPPGNPSTAKSMTGSQGDSARNRCNARDDAGSPTFSALRRSSDSGPVDNGCCSPWLPYDQRLAQSRPAPTPPHPSCPTSRPSREKRLLRR